MNLSKAQVEALATEFHAKLNKARSEALKKKEDGAKERYMQSPDGKLIGSLPKWMKEKLIGSWEFRREVEKFNNKVRIPDEITRKAIESSIVIASIGAEDVKSIMNAIYKQYPALKPK